MPSIVKTAASGSAQPTLERKASADLTAQACIGSGMWHGARPKTRGWAAVYRTQVVQWVKVLTSCIPDASDGRSNEHAAGAATAHARRH